MTDSSDLNLTALAFLPYEDAVTSTPMMRNEPRYKAQLNQSSSVTPNRTPEVRKRYKTELCRLGTSMQSCPFGRRCNYAHGIEELRLGDKHPLFKTVMCEAYHVAGLCPFGTNCVFIHNETEFQLNIIRRKILTTQIAQGSPMSSNF
ncbi:mRNA decay activator protein zfp36 [Cichlidogyrus casuarinus]|uniref:mRNA decay activator protein zfp36 n=1 Tax=Cichlidogyrus casuarinus TaxID=1844966 RepID=A0ABD2PMY3_9PLAT